MTPIPEKHQKHIRKEIAEGARLDAAHMLMNILAAVIASYGLMANSPAVVIGAMIVAMLLGPILGISLAVVDGEGQLFLRSLGSLGAGILAVLLTALFIGLMHVDSPITAEILSRTRPNLFDLMIALSGGAAGAYATVSPRLSVAFVGVAVATALVPPLSSASILLAHGEYSLSINALLLALTNVVAIQFACSTVFWVSGIRRIKSSEEATILTFARRDILSLVAMLVLAVFLGSNLQQTVNRQLYENAVRNALKADVEKYPGSYLADVRFETRRDTTIVRALVRGVETPSAAHIGLMEDALPKPPDSTVNELRVRFVSTDIIGRTGRLFADSAADQTGE